MKDDTISRQAAIDTLKNRWKKTHNYEVIGDDIAEECELYLKQVPSAQPGCEDAVSRTEAVEALFDWEQMYTWDEHCKEDGGESPYIVSPSSIIEKLPSVTPKQPGWIPTSERLPDNDRAVLVTLKWAEDDYEVAVGEYWHNSTASHGWGSFEGHVIAWHELPTPYREGKKS